MVRPCASPENRNLGILFARVVTVQEPCEQPSSVTIARSGEHSVFEMFTRCFRRCTRDNSRSGLSPIEMNKALEKAGFLRVRIRNAKKYHGTDESTQSFFRYGARRWRDPDNFQDMAYLRTVWPEVNKEAKVACPLAVLVQCLREAVDSCRPLDYGHKKRPSSRRSKPGPPPLPSPCALQSPQGTIQPLQVHPYQMQPLMRLDSIASQCTTPAATPRAESGSPPGAYESSESESESETDDDTSDIEAEPTVKLESPGHHLVGMAFPPRAPVVWQQQAPSAFQYVQPSFAPAYGWRPAMPYGGPPLMPCSREAAPQDAWEDVVKMEPEDIGKFLIDA